MKPRITGDAARRRWTELRRAQSDVLRLQGELQAIWVGAAIERRRATKRYDSAWATARANAVAQELVAAHARVGRLSAEVGK